MRSLTLGGILCATGVFGCGPAELEGLPPPVSHHEDRTDGFGDPPGSGVAFILSSFTILPPGDGFDLDGRCRAPGDCIDNALGAFGRVFNDEFRQSLLSGTKLVALELTGIDPPFHGDDANVTVRFYEVVDADDPSFPGNNFQFTDGDPTCCEFMITAESIVGSPPQARGRLPASIAGGRLSSRASPGLTQSLYLTNYFGGAARKGMLLDAARVSMELSSADTGAVGPGTIQIKEGILGGAVGLTQLASDDNPWCATLNSLCQREMKEASLLDLVAAITQADIDRDGDGLEKIEIDPNGRVGSCHDGDGSVVSPLDAARPSTCALSPRMADAFSLSLGFTAVPAKLIGIR